MDRSKQLKFQNKNKHANSLREMSTTDLIKLNNKRVFPKVENINE